MQRKTADGATLALSDADGLVGRGERGGCLDDEACRTVDEYAIDLLVRRRIRGDSPMKDIPELTQADFHRALSRSQRQRIIRGELQPGDVAALRRFIGLTQADFANALGISVHTLRNWEQDRRKPEGAALALLRIAARHPGVVRENVPTAA